MSFLDLNVPSASFPVCAHGMFLAPGMCPPLCACSVGYSGGARTSPLNSLGPLTSTRTLSPSRRDWSTYSLYTRREGSGVPTLYVDFDWDWTSLVTGLSSRSHFFLPPFISLIFSTPWNLKTQNAKVANQLLKSPYNMTVVSPVMPALLNKLSSCSLLRMSLLNASLMSFFQSNSTAPGMWPVL